VGTLALENEGTKCNDISYFKLGITKVLRESKLPYHIGPLPEFVTQKVRLVTTA